MKAKEKAAELVEKYDETLTYLESKSKAKQCALIAVDEILSMVDESMKGFLDSDIIRYWQECKQEIENL